MTKNKDAAPFNSLDFIMRFEDGSAEPLTLPELVEGFAQLIRSGHAWTLQGTYGRTAAALIENGLVDREGNVDHERVEQAEEEYVG